MVRYDSHQPKVLILYASYGEGHLQAAKAIREALKEQGNDRTVMVDLMAESHPWLNEMTRRVYKKSYTHIPHLYGWVYGFTRPMKHNSLFGGFLHSFGRDKIRKLLQKEKPDAVIHTFPFFALPALHRRRKSKGTPPSTIPSYAVITDFDLHRRWVHPGIGRYFVATSDLKQELGSLGIAPGRVTISGIPLRRGFAELTLSTELYAKYGLEPDKPIILLMPGAEGVMNDCEELCRLLLEQHPDAQIALVCGRNTLLHNTITSRFEQHSSAASRLHVYGFIEQIQELMALACCLVSKPGGVTIAEAIHTGLPLFLYRPVPGQEKRNALYLQSKGAAAIASTPEELTGAIIHMINHPQQLRERRMAVQSLQAEEDAAGSIADHILQECGWNTNFGQRYS